MASKRDLKNAKRLERIKARALQLSQENAPALTALAAVEVLEADLGMSQVETPLEPATETVNEDPVVILAPVEEPPVLGAVLVRVYLRPRHARMRLIELPDGSHGKMWVKLGAPGMIGWKVWARPMEGAVGEYELHGRYNGRGTRIK